jgi:L-lactate dehydrogenase complex protein LldG
MDSSVARRNILARIRAAQQRPPQAGETERAAVSDYLERHPRGPRPPVPDDLHARFRVAAIALQTTLDEVPSLADVPTAVKRYLDAGGLPARAIAWRTLAELPWSAAGCEVEFRPPRDGDMVGITGCFCATAETGSLALVSGPDTYPSASLLPETHIAILPVSRIVAGHEEAFRMMIAELGELPRAVNFISGPSRTADIEQTLVLGAHGPYRVHVITVMDA